MPRRLFRRKQDDQTTDIAESGEDDVAKAYWP